MEKTILLLEGENRTADHELDILTKNNYRVLPFHPVIGQMKDLPLDEADLILLDLHITASADSLTELCHKIIDEHKIPLLLLYDRVSDKTRPPPENLYASGLVEWDCSSWDLLAAVKTALRLHRQYEQQREGAERQAAQNQLMREQKNLLEAVFNSIQDGIAVLNTDLSIRFTNHVMKRWYAAQMPLAGKHCFYAFHANKAPCHPCPSLRSLKSGTTEVDIVPGRPDAKDIEWLEVYSYPIIDRDKGEITGVVEFIRNISQRVRNEKALKDSEARWQFALEGARDGIWDWNAQNNEVFFSRQWKEMLGFKEDEIKNSYDEWAGRIHPEDKKHVFAELEAHLQGETPYYKSEHRLRCKDGSYKWILDRGKVVERSESGEALRAIGTHTDISRQKEIQRQLQELVEEKSSLIREMNHRVKNNLALISSLIHLKSSEVPNVDLSDLSHQIDAIRIVHDKLNISDNIREVEVRGYINELIETVFASFAEGQVHTEVHIPQLSFSTRTVVSLGLIVNELAINAIKHGFRADEQAVFRLSLMREDPDRYSLLIENSGNPFPSDITMEKGGNLGLQLISTLVKQLNGTVELKKEPHPSFTIFFMGDA